MFSQGVHQIDIVRLLAGGLARDVVALTGNWDPKRPTEGAYTALLSFEQSMASLTYSGYAHFDSDEWMGDIGELGNQKNPADYGKARRALKKANDPAEEVRLKEARTYGVGPVSHANVETFEHFGPIIVSCEHADLRITPQGIHIYNDSSRVFRPTPPFRFQRSEVTDLLFNALRRSIMPVQTGVWGLASLEVCHAIIKAAQSRQPVELKLQVDLRGNK